MSVNLDTISIISLLIGFIGFLTVYCIQKAKIHVLEMKVTYLEKLKQCIIYETKEVKVPIKEPSGLQVYKAVRQENAPDIGLAGISKIVVVALTRSEAMEILKKDERFTDDGWWVLEDIKEPSIINIEYQGGVL